MGRTIVKVLAVVVFAELGIRWFNALGEWMFA